VAGNSFKTPAEVEAVLRKTPLHRWLGLRIVAMDARRGQLSVAVPIRGNAARFDDGEQAHGGAILLGRAAPTMNLRVDYLRPAIGDEMLATATVRRAGRTVTVVDVNVEAGGKLVALGRCAEATGAWGGD